MDSCYVKEISMKIITGAAYCPICLEADYHQMRQKFLILDLQKNSKFFRCLKLRIKYYEADFVPIGHHCIQNYGCLPAKAGRGGFVP